MDKGRNKRYLQEQNLLGAITGGFIGIILASVTWMLVVSLYKLEINLLAVAVGFIVGYTVKILGKGVTFYYGIVGVIFTAAGCISGRLLSILTINAITGQTSLVEMILDMDKDMAFYLLESTFELQDLIFYLIALFIGYYNSFRK